MKEIGAVRVPNGVLEMQLKLLTIANAIVEGHGGMVE